MKLRWWMTTAAGLCAASSMAGADEYSEFRIPEHKSRLWNVSASAVAAGSKLGLDTRESKSTYGSGDLSTSLTWIKDSDPLRRIVSIGGLVGMQGNKSRDQVPLDGSTGHQSNREASESWNASIAERRYPWSVPVGIDYSVGGSGDYGQRWSKNGGDHTGPTSSFSFLNSQEAWTYRTGASGTITLGAGRVRDATGVQEARVIEHRLEEAGVLARPLSAAAREKLARLMYTRYDLDVVADRPASYLWSAVMAIIEEDAALGDKARDPGAWSHAFDPYIGATSGYGSNLVPQPTIIRNTGFFVGPVFQFSHSDLRVRNDLTYNSSSTVDSVFSSSTTTSAFHLQSSETQTFGGIFAEWHRPLSLEWQGDAYALYWVPLKDTNDRYTFEAFGQVSYLVADRWTGAITTSYAQGDFDPTQRWTVNVVGTLTFYMQDHLALTLSAADLQGHSRDPNAYQRAQEVRIAMTYRVSGSFSAPGLLTPTLGQSVIATP